MTADVPEEESFFEAVKKVKGVNVGNFVSWVTIYEEEALDRVRHILDKFGYVFYNWRYGESDELVVVKYEYLGGKSPGTVIIQYEVRKPHTMKFGIAYQIGHGWQFWRHPSRPELGVTSSGSGDEAEKLRLRALGCLPGLGLSVEDLHLFPLPPKPHR